MTLLVGFPTRQDDRAGVEFAATLARSSGQDLLLVTVVPASWPTPVAGHTDREFEQWAEQTGERAVAEAEALLADHCPDVTGGAIWIAGRSIPGALLAHAERIEASMIVVGSGHDGAYGHVNLSSTADRLLHSSHVPVAVATRGYQASEHGRVVRATCAFRGDEVSQATLERTAEICKDVGATLRIATFAVRGKTMYPPEVAHAEDMVLDRWLAQATAMQEQAVEKLSSAGILPEGAERVVASGRSWAYAIDRLPWQRDEVLVVGPASSATLMSRLFRGSSPAKIVRHSPVPVIVVP
jgi:nucleotide-binding universal stress UspA family protein